MGAIAVSGSAERPRNGTVLVVEDEVLVRMSLAETLRDDGFFVLEAANADEAMAVLASSTPIDIVLTDVNMPGSLDGVALGRHARTTRPGLKVMIVSGRVPPTAASDAADAFLAKPYEAASVVKAINTLLPKRCG